MPARRHTERDQRRRTHGQNFLADRAIVDRLLARLDLAEGESVVEFGAGSGALTLPLAHAGAKVMAIEADPVWASRLRERVADHGLSDRVRVVRADLRAVRLPTTVYRVVANPPFGLTTWLLAQLLDDPDRGPARADLLVQWEVARKRAAQPPTTLKSAAWAPWWTFDIAERVDRRAFRPVPAVDAAFLTIRRREPPVLPTWLAPAFAESLRQAWAPPGGVSRRP